MPTIPHKFTRLLVVFGAVALVALVGVSMLRVSRGGTGGATGGASEPEATIVVGGRTYAVQIRKPEPPRTVVGVDPVSGADVTVACGTCHATRAPVRATATASDLDEFHQGLVVAHSALACLSCHHEEDYDSLRLAGGERVPFGEVMTLCAQCHSGQAMDYEHGAHGGMQGYWDLTRGPRTRHVCIDCHDPHAPAFPMMEPTFKPFDRFLTPTEGSDRGHTKSEAGHGR